MTSPERHDSAFAERVAPDVLYLVGVAPDAEDDIPPDRARLEPGRHLDPTEQASGRVDDRETRRLAGRAHQ